jgi:ectoine hydroxylase-related dioxygenase (phytanoyl-CoA dioxygenase family)
MCFGYGRGMQHGWHQDSGALEAGQFVLNRIVYPHGLSRDQGALYFVPASTHRGLLTADPGPNHGPIQGEVELLPTPGTLVLMHTRCFHRVGANRTASPRVMLNTRASPGGARADVTRSPVFRSQTWDHSTGQPWD